MAGADFGTRLIFRFIWPSELRPFKAHSLSLSTSARWTMAVAFYLLATGFELRAHPHQLGLRLAVLERFFALLQIVAETSQGVAFQDTIQEIADVQVGMLVGCLLVGGAADNRKAKCVGVQRPATGFLRFRVYIGLRKTGTLICFRQLRCKYMAVGA